MLLDFCCEAKNWYVNREDDETGSVAQDYIHSPS